MSTTPPLAIVGIGAFFPGSTSAAGFWQDIVSGTDLIGDIPADHWLIEDYYDPDPSIPDKTYGKRGAFLPKIDFDALGFGVPPSIMPATDTSQLLGLIIAQQVLEDACGSTFHDMDKERCSVILGVTGAQKMVANMVARLQHPVWRKALRDMGLPESEVEEAVQRIGDHYAPWQEATFPGLLGNVVAGRIANRLDLHGTNCVTDAACASSFAAVSMATRELYLGDSDMVIVGGVDTMNDYFMHMCFSKTPALSKSGDCRPFSESGDGTLLGEGVGMFALKRLEDAEANGDRIYALIRGVGSSSDGRSKSVYAPVSEGQARALRRAYDKAGFEPRTIELVEAHGTGTVAGDAAEFRGLQQVFGHEDATPWCAVGSVKSQIGHTKAAAGAAGLFKTVMGLQHRILPPSIKVDRPNPAIPQGSGPLYVNVAARPWVRGSDHPRRAGVSAFGFGGSNFHVAVEEYTGPNRAPRKPIASTALVLLHAPTAQALVQACRELRAEVSEAAVQAIARRTQLAFDATAAHRLCLVVDSADSLTEGLDQAISRIPEGPFSLPTDVVYATGSAQGEVGFLFPGQGSQYLNMGDRVAMAFESALGVWDLAADLDFGETSLHAVNFPRPVFDEAERAAQSSLLTETEWAQPAIGAVSLGLLRILRAVGLQPAAVAGHSFGEIPALVAAGVLTERDGLRVARARGEAMARAAQVPGAMLAVRKSREEVEAKLPELEGVVIANHNHPTQVVLSGPTEAIERAEGVLASHGWRARRLSVATAFHSSVVAPAVDELASFLAEINVSPPQLTALAGATAQPYPAEADAIRATLSGQLAQQVAFVDTVEAMYARGVRTFAEVGPGSVLSGLVAKILGDRPHTRVALDRKGKDGLQRLWAGLGQLAVAGHALDLAPLWEGLQVQDPADAKAPRLAVPISGALYGQPYPPEGGAAALPAPNGPRPEPEPRVIERIVEVPVSSPSQPSASGHPTSDAWAADAQLAPTDAWLHAFEQTQAETARAHQAFQEQMASVHHAFLDTVSQSMDVLNQLAGGAPSPGIRTAPRPTMTTTAFAPVPTPAYTPPAPAPAPVAAAPAPVAAAPAPAIAPTPAPTPVAAAATAGIDLRGLLLEVIAEKTGYPADMLDLSMDLEADLGVDSIKRVEILSGMREREPGLPEVDASELAQLRTLAQIVDAMDAAGGGIAAAPASQPAASGIDLTGLLLEVIAEKTGYPADMLDLSMDLEADLGVDSIKRVEILSGMREREPGLPEVDASELAQLRTLAQIVDAMDAAGGGIATTPASQPAASGIDLTGLLLEVIAEKTGYPADMLDLSMDLEADLGVDSIKRVEILSGMREREPGLPEVDASELAQLRTLAQIVDAMGAAGGIATAPASPPAASGIDLTGLLLEVIAEKTGYPADMLDLSMDLEADLGVDSIKRVEILSGMREREPGLPEVDASELAQLRTLAQIVDAMGAAGHGASSASPTTEAARPTEPEGPPIQRFVVRPIPAPAQGIGLHGLFAGPVAVTPGRPGLAEAVVTGLVEAGVQADLCETPGPDHTGLIFLGGAQSLDVEDALAVQRAAFLAAKAIAGRATCFVTVQATGGDFGLTGSGQAWSGGLAGLVKTAALEWPDAGCRAIDVQDLQDEALAERIVSELLTGGTETEVGLGADGRCTLQTTAESPASGPATLGTDSVVVASGGGRGVTAACLIAQAQETGGRFALLGRTPLAEEGPETANITDDAGLKRALLQASKAAGEALSPRVLNDRVRRLQAAREVRATLSALDAAGATGRYVVCDVSDGASVQRALSEVRDSWGPIDAVVHGAGVLADKSIVDKTPEQFQRVFDTKVIGLRNLLEATAEDPLGSLVLFSSVAARVGNPGQCDYAMANETLNKVAGQLNAQGRTRAHAIGWGPWEGGMVTDALARLFKERGVALIPLQTGARMLVEEMADDGDVVETVVGGGQGLGVSTPQIRGVVHASRGAHPFVHDHRIGGTAVLPMVVAAEWLARAGKAVRPDLRLKAIRDVRVLKGIRLDGYDQAGDAFALTSRQLSNGHGAEVSAELSDLDGRKRYAAQVLLDEPRDVVPVAKRLTAPRDLTPWKGDVYEGDLLFHGPAMQVIRELSGISDDGLCATLSGSAGQAWATSEWLLDVGALDGVLQAAILWGGKVLGSPCLPMRIGELTLYQTGPQRGALEVTLRRRSVSADKAVCDADLRAEDGTVIATLSHVETLRRPDTRRTAPSTRV